MAVRHGIACASSWRRSQTVPIALLHQQGLQHNQSTQVAVPIHATDRKALHSKACQESDGLHSCDLTCLHVLGPHGWIQEGSRVVCLGRRMWAWRRQNIRADSRSGQGEVLQLWHPDQNQAGINIWGVPYFECSKR